MKILIGGDVVPNAVNADLFIKGDMLSLMGRKLKDVWDSADFRIINLEAPLTDSDNPIPKWGPNLKAPVKASKGVLGLNPGLVSLANNHVMDFGADGYKDTVKILEDNNIPYVGSGNNLAEAAKPFVLEAGNKKIGIYSCAEHEFTIADNDSPGANPFDALFSLDHISQLKEKCDYVIVLYHGGKEYYRYPSPRLRQVCRKIADKGADLILCQHSHCIGSFEEYEGSTILYGQGNFLFCKDFINEFLGSGLLVSIDFEEDAKIEFIPFFRFEQGVRFAKGDEKTEIMDTFFERSENIKKDGFIEERYKEFAKEKHFMYMRKIAGKSDFFEKMDGKLFNYALTKRLYPGRLKCMLRNYMQCEAHRELVLGGIKGDDL